MKKSLSNRSKVSVSALVSLVGVASVSTGCSASADETVAPRVEVINQTKSALSAASITSITGTYGTACSGRAGTGTDNLDCLDFRKPGS